VYLPWVLPKFDRAIMLGWNLLFEDDWTELVDFDLKGHVIGAARNVEWIGWINGVFPDTRDFVSSYLGIEDPYSVISTAVLVLDLKKLRETTTFSEVVDRLHSFDRVLDDFEAFNAIYAGKAEIIPQRFDVKVATYPGFDDTINDVPVELAKEYKAAKADPVIVQYNHYDPWWMVGADHEVEFWKYARQSDLYEAFIEAMVNIHVLAGKEGRQEESQARRIINRILPYGSKRREVAQAIAPRGSLLFNVARSAAEKVLPNN
jgi:lipopolysaccharide biosynthesis glycosyltransferase